MLGLPFTVGALVFGLASVGLIGVLRDTSRVKGDAAIGVVFTGFFATGLILKSRYPSNTDLNSIIFGNVLGISPADRTMVLALALGVAVVLIARRRDLTLFAFDPVHAHAIGLRPGRINALLLVLLALTTIVALQVVGVILVVAMLIVPGTTAHLLTDRMGRMLIIAPLIATVSTVVGLYIAYWTNASAAGWVTVCQALAFLAAYLGSPRHGVLPVRSAAGFGVRAMADTWGMWVRSLPWRGVLTVSVLSVPARMGRCASGIRPVVCSSISSFRSRSPF